MILILWSDDGLYEVQVSRNSTKALSVSVFPLVGTNSLQQAMFLLHASLSPISNEAIIELAKSGIHHVWGTPQK